MPKSPVYICAKKGNGIYETSYKTIELPLDSKEDEKEAYVRSKVWTHGEIKSVSPDMKNKGFHFIIDESKKKEPDYLLMC